MTNVAILILLFTASQHPTQKNCVKLRDGLMNVAMQQALQKDNEVRFDEDLVLIKEFVTKTCKDGIKRPKNQEKRK